MQKPNFSQVYKWVFISALTIILTFALNDIGLIGTPQKYYVVFYLVTALLLSTAIVQLAWIAIPKIAFLITSFFKTPNFSNVKISFLETKAGEISIYVKNEEWRYPSIDIEALSGGNLKWFPFQMSDIAKIEKRGSKYAAFLKVVNNELHIDSKNNQVEKLPIGKHEIRVAFYIAVEKIRIARTYILDIVYKGEENISIVNVIQLQDMPHSDEAWLIYEIKNNLSASRK